MQLYPWIFLAHQTSDGPSSLQALPSAVPPVAVEALKNASTFPFPDPATFSWLDADLHSSVVIGVAVLVFLYWYGIGPARKKYTLSPIPVETWRIVSFAGAILTLMVCSNGPIHHLSDNYLFSVHMVQHLAYTQVFPPLFLLAIPAWLWRPLVKPVPVQKIGRFLARPLWAFLISSFVLAFWHLPQFYELAMRHHDYHVLEHLLFIISAVIMWFPVINPIPELIPAPGDIWKMIYLFLTTLPMALIGIFVAMAEHVLYPFYAEAPRIFPGFTALADQSLGGLIMWVPGAMLPWVAIAIIWFRWFSSQRDGVDTVVSSA